MWKCLTRCSMARGPASRWRWYDRSSRMSVTIEPRVDARPPLGRRTGGAPRPSERPPRSAIDWRRDPRVPFAIILTTYVVMGTLWLGFNRSPQQILTTIAAGCVLDMALHWLLRERELLVPLSAYISALSIAILLNY